MTSELDTAEPADVLLVEDSPGDIRLTKEAFKQGQIANTLHVVEDGIDALEEAAAGDRVGVDRERSHRDPDPRGPRSRRAGAR